MQTSHVHPRLGVSPFLKFEPYFLEAYRAMPGITEIVIANLSPHTICARMRDSLSGFRANRWTEASPEFVELFDKWDRETVITLTKDLKVIIRPRDLLGRPAKGGLSFSQAIGDIKKYVKAVPLAPSLSATIRIYGIPTEQQIEQLVLLRAAEVLRDPIIFIGDISAFLASAISAYDLSFHYDPQRNETILL